MTSTNWVQDWRACFLVGMSLLGPMFALSIFVHQANANPCNGALTPCFGSFTWDQNVKLHMTGNTQTFTVKVDNNCGSCTSTTATIQITGSSSLGRSFSISSSVPLVVGGAGMNGPFTMTIVLSSSDVGTTFSFTAYLQAGCGIGGTCDTQTGNFDVKP